MKESIKLDARVFAMCQMKTLPLSQLMLYVCPEMYSIHNIADVVSSSRVLFISRWDQQGQQLSYLNVGE